MQLPINAPDLNFDALGCDEAIWKLVGKILENNASLQVKHVRLSQVTKKLLIRLQDGTTREQLEAIKVRDSDSS